MDLTDIDACDGGLVINTVDMRTPAWYVLDLTSLWELGTVRGSDVVIPGATGVRPFRRRVTATTKSLPMLIDGRIGPTGTPFSNIWEGLQSNVNLLNAYVVTPATTTAGTRAATLTMPDATTRTADVHVLSLVLGDPVADGSHAFFKASLELSIPSGAFT